MRKFLLCAALTAATILMLAPATAEAKLKCKPGQVVSCRDMGKTAAPLCRCVTKPGDQSGSQGKAEIKKKNVPTVKPSKAPGGSG